MDLRNCSTKNRFERGDFLHKLLKLLECIGIETFPWNIAPRPAPKREFSVYMSVDGRQTPHVNAAALLRDVRRALLGDLRLQFRDLRFDRGSQTVFRPNRRQSARPIRSIVTLICLPQRDHKGFLLS